MRVIIQKAIVKVIQPQKVEYYCDNCGNLCGTRENPKTTVYTNGNQKHWCKKTCEWQETNYFKSVSEVAPQGEESGTK